MITPKHLPAQLEQPRSGPERLIDELVGELELPARRAGKQRLLTHVTQGIGPFEPFFTRIARVAELSVAAVEEAIERSLETRQWDPGPPGYSLFHFEGGGSHATSDVGLVRGNAGARFPTHTHLGPEEVVILRGSYTDLSDGRTYTVGQVHRSETGSQHAFEAGLEGVLFAVAVVGIEIEGFGRYVRSQR